jgi:DNA-binding MarR family transcriptional regulator
MEMGLSAAEAAELGPDAATRIRAFRLILVLAQQLRTLMDQRLRGDGLTTQQAALITVTEALGGPTLSQAAAALGTTHQNARQVAAALERKGFLLIEPDAADGRVRRLRTTPRSRDYWRERSPGDQRHVLEWFAGLSAAEARLLLDLLARIHQQAAQRPAGEEPRG